MDHSCYMALALEQAKMAAQQGDVPVGCVIVQDNAVVGMGYNRRELNCDACSHAEIEAIRDACQRLGSWRLSDCDIYVTLEPCPMCAGAIINARLRSLYYGAKEPDMGCCGSVLNLFEERFHHHPRIYGGILQTECKAILQDFFKDKR